MKVTEIRPAFVAEINGIDLRNPLDQAGTEAIQEAIDHHGVLVFRNQNMSDDQQIAFARHFGPLEVTRARPRRGLAREMGDISNLGAQGEVLGQGERARLVNLANQLWHTDSSFREPPAKYSILSARVVPSVGGETEYADTCAAYDRLADETKERIAELSAEHSSFHSRGLLGFTDFSEEERRTRPPIQQPLVRTLSPSGRKALYVASHASHVVGMPVAEGRLLLIDLMLIASQPDVVYRHTWQVGDVVMWDNRRTMHRGRPFNDVVDPRDLRRVTVSDTQE